MRHSARRRLAVDDIDVACSISKAPRLIGHLSPPSDMLACPAPVRIPPDIASGESDAIALRYLAESDIDPLILLRHTRVANADRSPSTSLSALRVTFASSADSSCPSASSTSFSSAPLTQAEAAYSAHLRRLLLLRRPQRQKSVIIPSSTASSNSLKQQQPQQILKHAILQSSVSMATQPPFYHLLRHLASTDTPALGRILSRLLQFLGRLCRRYGHSSVLLWRCLRCLESCAVNPNLNWSTSESNAAIDLLCGLLSSTPACSVWRPAEAVDLQELAASLLSRLRRGGQSNSFMASIRLIRRLLQSPDSAAAASALQAAVAMPPLLRHSWQTVSSALPRLQAHLLPVCSSCSSNAVGSASDVESVAAAARLRSRLVAYLRRSSLESTSTSSSRLVDNSDDNYRDGHCSDHSGLTEVEDDEQCNENKDHHFDWRIAAFVYDVVSSSEAFASTLDLPLYQFRSRTSLLANTACPQQPPSPLRRQRYDFIGSLVDAENVDGLLMLLEEQQQQHQAVQSNQQSIHHHHHDSFLPMDLGDVDQVIGMDVVGGAIVGDPSSSAGGSPNSRPPVLEPAMPQLGLMQDDPVPSQLPLLGDDDDDDNMDPTVGHDACADRRLPASGSQDVSSCLIGLLEFEALPIDQCSEASTLPATNDRPLTPPLASELPLRLMTASVEQKQQQQPIFELISPPLPQFSSSYALQQPPLEQQQQHQPVQKHRPLFHPSHQPTSSLFSIDPDVDSTAIFESSSQFNLAQKRQQIVIKLAGCNSSYSAQTQTALSSGQVESEFYRLFQQLKWRFGWGIGRAAVASRSRAGVFCPDGNRHNADIVPVLPDFAYPL